MSRIWVKSATAAAIFNRFVWPRWSLFPFDSADFCRSSLRAWPGHSSFFWPWSATPHISRLHHVSFLSQLETGCLWCIKCVSSLGFHQGFGDHGICALKRCCEDWHDLSRAFSGCSIFLLEWGSAAILSSITLSSSVKCLLCHRDTAPNPQNCIEAQLKLPTSHNIDRTSMLLLVCLKHSMDSMVYHGWHVTSCTQCN